MDQSANKSLHQGTRVTTTLELAVSAYGNGTVTGMGACTIRQAFYLQSRASS
jgi:hypothetical protein